MKFLALILLAVFALAAAGPAPDRPSGVRTDIAGPEASPRFTTLDVYIDAKNAPLAAYQFEFKALRGEATIVGIEGGNAAAFREAPYYDPAALSHNRVIVAAFSTGKDMPAGKTRVARLHLRVTGTRPQYDVKLAVAASADGARIPATIEFGPGANP